MKVLITGAFGFIGSCISQKLASSGASIIACDEILKVEQIPNALKSNFSDWVSPSSCIEYLESSKDIDLVVHQGAITDTTFNDGLKLRQNNYDFSKNLAEYSFANDKKFIYASSASVYGNVGMDKGQNFEPLNLYGFSKLAFDRWISGHGTGQNYLGLRYFNVYGPGEAHKGRMASVAYHAMNELAREGTISLFGASEGIERGEQKRDFVFVTDIAEFTNYAATNSTPSGIFDFGTGVARTFNDLAKIIISNQKHGEIKYIDFPDDLIGKYQSFTQARMDWLALTGYSKKLTSLEGGVMQYLNTKNH